MSKNALAAVSAALLVLFALPAIGEARSEHHSSIAKNPASVLNGIYRVSYTEKELVSFGTTAQYAKQNYGVSTLRLADGGARYKNSRSAFRCSGSYAVSGKTVTFDFNVPHCRGIVKATWAFQAGSLRFRVIVASDQGDAQVFGSKPWKKIG